MNRLYRLVWDRAHGAWRVAAEIARGRGKGGRATRPRKRLPAWLLMPLLGLPPIAQAVQAPRPAPVVRLPATAARAPAGITAPGRVLGRVTTPSADAARLDGLTGGRITAGQGRIDQGAHVTTITQHSQTLSLAWQTFDVGADDSVHFVQPGADALAVNRIADPDGSVILGHLDANGQVWLINPNGILFGKGARVDVGGLVASTLALDGTEAGRARFAGTGRAAVVNRGRLVTSAGGYVALIGAQVSNQGSIRTPAGTTALGAGSVVNLQFDGRRLLSLRVQKGTLDALAENRQLIQADGGRVLMTAGAKDSLLASVVNNSGVIQARTVGHRDGRIVLLGGMQAGTAHVAGTLDASAPDGGDGGFVETSAAHVKITDAARITTRAGSGRNGQWLIDPQDFTIAASGGDITGAVLGTQLAGGNVAIESSAGATAGNGDILVNDVVNWNANTLTLTAARNIDINATLTAGGDAGLALNPATANGADVAVAGGTVNIMPGLGRVDFTGAGNSLSVNGTPYILVTSLAQLQGMNGDLGGHYALAGDIDASATSGWNADGNGGFAGFEPIGTSDGYDTSFAFTGVFDGLGHTIDGLTINRPDTDAVGLFGAIAGADASVRNVGLRGGSTRGRDRVGALVGFGDDSGPISHAYATGDVHGRDNVGGLIGYLEAKADYIYATGDVEGTGNVGGLIGYGENSQIQYTYASGDVHGGSAGGLVGRFMSFAPWYSYATGDVTGTVAAGGLVGSYDHGSVWYSYATGQVTGAEAGLAAGLIGDSQFVNVLYSYWDRDSTGQSEGCSGGCDSPGPLYAPVGLGTAEAFQKASYANFDFDDIWFMVDGETRPFLRFEYATAIGNAHQLQLMAMDLTAGYTLAGDIDASMTDGSRASGMWSSRGFDPVGDAFRQFIGSLDGSGHTISGLAINRPDTDYVGLFGYAGAGSMIRNLGLLGGSVAGHNSTGGLAGVNYDGTISQAYATGVVGGNNSTGGLVGVNYGTVTQSHATGNVTGVGGTGGLVGNNGSGATITQSYATGTASGSGTYAGGLVGVNVGGTIAQSYATGAASGDQRVGGLAGGNTNAGTVMQSYATGAVTGGGEVGGLVGYNYGSTITQSYAIGAVTGTSLAGGLVGRNEGTVADSYWDTESTGQATSAGGTALTSTAMRQAGSFAGWDIASGGGSDAAWRIYEGHTTPLLRAFMTAAAVTVNGSLGSKTYDGHAGSGEAGSYAAALANGDAADVSLLLGSLDYATTGADAGTYTLANGDLVLSGLYSGQSGYDISYAGTAGYAIDKASLVVTASDAGKTYDGVAWHGGNGVSYSGFVGGEDASVLSGNLAYGGNAQGAVDAGDYTITASGLASGNYTITYVDGTLDVARKTLSGTITADDKVYDGTTTATTSGTLVGVIAGDTVDFDTSGAFADKNAGVGKTVAVSGSLSGTDAGNYTLADNATATASITPKTIDGTITADDKVYDGTTAATTHGVLAGVVAGDTVAFDTSGRFADKNVGTGKTVTVSGTLSGADAGNYMLADNVTAAAAITPATLTYVADPASFLAGQAPADLGGRVIGLVGGETLAEATDGDLTWSTSATLASPAGSYAIEGDGLEAVNYVFRQAPGNATALTLTAPPLAPSRPPIRVTAQVAALQQTLTDVYAPTWPALGAFPDRFAAAVQPSRYRPRAPARPVGGSLHAPDIHVIDGGVRLP